MDWTYASNGLFWLISEGISNFEAILNMTEPQDEFGEVLYVKEFIARFTAEKW